MNYENYYNDFDEESKKVLQSSFSYPISGKQFLNKALQVNTPLQKDSKMPLASSLVSGMADWQSDEYINLELLVSKIKYANNGMRDYALEYNPKDYKAYIQSKSISLPGGSYIMLKAYLNSKAENVSVKWDRAQITQEIIADKEKIYYRIGFFYDKTSEKAIVLETYSYQEFRDLNILLGYGDIDKYKDDYEYFLKNFADTLKKYKSPESLKFIYENIPETILPNLFSQIDNITLFNHLEILSNADDSDIFRDSSSAVIQIFKIIGDPVPVLNYFRKNTDKLNMIYYNLDGSTEYDGEMKSNRMILAHIMMLFSMFANNDKRKKEAKTFTIGQGYKINSDILEMGIFQSNNDQYRDTFFLQQQKEIQQRVKIVPKESNPEETETVTENLDGGAQFHPLDMVYLIDISDGTEETYFVPAIYLKALADAQEWAVVHRNIRFAANLVAIVIGVTTLATTGNPYFIILAAADISLAGADITIQTFKEEIVKYEGGEEFLENWEKIYMAGGFTIAGLTIIGGFYIGAARLLAKIADGSAKNYLKTLVLKAVLETNISNFQRNTIKVLEPQEIFLGAEYKALGNTMAENGVVFLGGQKEGKFAESYAAVYKGEVIQEFTKAEMRNFYKKWSKLQGEELIEELEYFGGHVPPGHSIVVTDIETKVKDFIEGKKQFSGIIIENPFKEMKNAIQYFNHHVVGNVIEQIDYENCANVVDVIIEFLKTGNLRSAEASGYQSFDKIIAKCGGGRFGDTTFPSLAKEAVLKENEIAIIYGAKEYHPSGKVDGHYFVAVKKEKKLHLFDGQTGEYVIYDLKSTKARDFLQRNYIKFMYTKVGKIKN